MKETNLIKAGNYQMDEESVIIIGFSEEPQA
jgi:hypothetical protein